MQNMQEGRVWQKRGVAGINLDGRYLWESFLDVFIAAMSALNSLNFK